MTNASQPATDPRAIISSISTRLNLVAAAIKSPTLDGDTIETIILAIKDINNDLAPVLQHIEDGMSCHDSGLSHQYSQPGGNCTHDNVTSN